MSDAELNEKVARAMGFKILSREEMVKGALEVWETQPGCIHFLRGFDAWEIDGIVTVRQNFPDFLADPRAFVDLLLWHAKEGREPEVGYSNFNDAGREWFASFYPGDRDGQPAIGHGDTPARALALATCEWKEGAK